MKKLLFSIAAAALLVASLAPISGAETKLKSYYSGAVTYYSGNIVIATTNTGAVELFKAEPGQVPVKFASFKSTNLRFNAPTDFYDVALHTENGRLFAYLVDGRSLQKYDISNLKQANRVNRVEDGGWDWFGGVTIVGAKVATIGSNGVKVWNNDMTVVDSYNVKNRGNNTYNISPAGSDKFLFNIFNSSISIFDRDARVEKTTIPLDFKWGSDWFKRSVFNDRLDDAVYVVDDTAVRKINFAGEIEKSFKHTGNLGYDVVPSSDGQSIYFSDGIGVVKLRKSDLAVLNYTYTSDLGMGNGWAMGIRTVNTPEGEQLVVFNSSSIILLDSKLKPIKANRTRLAYVSASEEDSFPEITEALFLRIDKARAPAGSTVILNGGGYGKYENLTIKFAGVETAVVAGFDGRFTQELIVPARPASGSATDIKVTGATSHYSYNLGFFIE